VLPIQLGILASTDHFGFPEAVVDDCAVGMDLVRQVRQNVERPGW